ncbi:hypothetical protein HaLaN_20846, partial [Haematococcus lacustris]
MELPISGQEEAQLLNPPFAHALATPAAVTGSASRPWCQLVAVAQGDGSARLVCNTSSSATSSSANTSSASNSSGDNSSDDDGSANNEDGESGLLGTGA